MIIRLLDPKGDEIKKWYNMPETTQVAAVGDFVDVGVKTYEIGLRTWDYLEPSSPVTSVRMPASVICTLAWIGDEAYWDAQ